MLMSERHNQVLQLVKEKTYASVEELSKLVYASPATIRRDLHELEKLGLIQRVRGGASIIGTDTGEVSSIIRKQTNVVEKRRIAAMVSPFLQDGSSYFLDSSTSAGAIIPHLIKLKDATVFTNSLENALLLTTGDCDVIVYLAPGVVQPKAASTVGSDTADFMRCFNCETLFFSCHGFSLEHGPSEGTIEQQRIKKIMVQQSKNRILLVDHTKFGISLVAPVCGLKDINVIVTDEMPAREYVEKFKEFGIRLIVTADENR